MREFSCPIEAMELTNGYQNLNTIIILITSQDQTSNIKGIQFFSKWAENSFLIFESFTERDETNKLIYSLTLGFNVINFGFINPAYWNT